MTINDLDKDKKYLIIMTGISGSGKSTIVKKIKDDLNCQVVETDYIREQLTENASDQSKNNLVFAVAETRVKEYLSKEKTTIFDATNLTPKDRKKFVEIGKSFDNTKIVSVYIVPILSVANSRNNSRSRIVPSDVILKQYQKFRTPTSLEGFDIIISVNND